MSLIILVGYEMRLAIAGESEEGLVFVLKTKVRNFGPFGGFLDSRN